MKVILKEELENCFDGDFVIKFSFDTQWIKETIQSLKALGQLTYYESFPKPMFQLECPDGSFIKGVQGTNECRVIYARDLTSEDRIVFNKRFEEIIREGGKS